MEKEFIGYAEALYLKELGFDEPCFGWYAHNGVYTGYSIKNSTINELNMIKNSCSTPLYQQAFRWFREKYKLQCYPMLDTEDIYWCLFSDGMGSGYLLKDGDYGYESDEHLEFKTYEEAELECLKKLIEIVKK